MRPCCLHHIEAPWAVLHVRAGVDHLGGHDDVGRPIDTVRIEAVIKAAADSRS
jgi:hypothetical protein